MGIAEIERIVAEDLGLQRHPLHAQLIAEGGSPLLTKLVMSFAEVCKAPRYTPTTARSYLGRLAAFVRDGRCNLYSGEQRIVEASVHETRASV